jgi:NitT/TauT family transport system substrate-binding protein
VAYFPDAELGTRWFADKSVWAHDGANYLPFGTLAGARRYVAAHPGSVAQMCRKIPGSPRPG